MTTEESKGQNPIVELIEEAEGIIDPLESLIERAAEDADIDVARHQEAWQVLSKGFKR